MEVPEHCVESVIEIRRFLTSEIGLVDQGELSSSLRAMRAACRKFVDRVQAHEGDIIRFGAHRGHWASWEFSGALGELRGVFGIYLAKIASAFGLDVEDDLASILPGKDAGNGG